MKISRKKNRNQILMKFDGELTIYSAMQSRDLIFQDQEAWPELVALDLHAVEELDTAGVQLLLLMDKLQRARAGRVVIDSSNEQVDRVLELLDITHYFAPGVSQ